MKIDTLTQPLVQFTNKTILIEAVLNKSLSMFALMTDIAYSHKLQKEGLTNQSMSKELAKLSFLGDKTPHETILELHDKYEKILSEQNYDFPQALMLRTISDYYDAFELFVSDVITNTLTHYPGYISKISKSLSGNYNILWQYENIEDLRIAFIEKYAHDLLFSTDIGNALLLFGKILDIDFAIPKDAVKDLFRWSKIRNIIIHANGIVNTVFLKQLRERGIGVTEFDLGKRVFHLTKRAALNEHLATEALLLRKIATTVTEYLVADQERLGNHSAALQHSNFA